MKSKQLINGIEIPSIIYGTDLIGEWREYSSFFQRMKEKREYLNSLKKSGNQHLINIDRDIEKLVKKAMESGITAFDTSRAYGGSEYALGQALKSYKREDYFIVSKISNLDQRTIGARKSLEISLNKLNMDYVDLYLIHWPQPETYIDIWHEFEQLYREGKCKAIGVCNCKIHHLESIISQSEIKPMVNEFEVHPLLTEEKICEYCNDNDIQILAYTSTARMDSRLTNSPRIKNICKKYSKSPAQIILRWHVQENRIPIFNTTSVNHLAGNNDIWDFELSDEDMRIISGMNINSRLRYDSDNCDYEIL